MQPVTRLFTIATVAALSVAAALAPYFIRFSGPPSSEQKDWADFGAYVGGVTAPVLAFASLIAVLYTVHSQWIELRRSSIASARTAELQRLSGLLALRDHYRQQFQHQAELLKLLAGMTGGKLAEERIAELDARLREVSTEIEYFHAACLVRPDA